jgi:hypothetical protein
MNLSTRTDIDELAAEQLSYAACFGIAHELEALAAAMSEGEHPLGLATCQAAGVFGVLALTTQHLLWVPCSEGQISIRRIPLAELTGVTVRPDRYGARFETRNRALSFEVEQVIPPDILSAVMRHPTNQSAHTAQHARTSRSPLRRAARSAHR